MLEIIANDHPFDLPKTMVDDQHKHLIAQYRERLQQAKLADEEIEKRVAEADEQARQDAERRVRMFFLFDAIARQEKIGVAEDDIRLEIESIAERHGVSPQEVQTYYQENKMLPDLQLGVLERKVRDFLIENAKITDNEAQTS